MSTDQVEGVQEFRWMKGSMACRVGFDVVIFRTVTKSRSSGLFEQRFSCVFC